MRRATKKPGEYQIEVVGLERSQFSNRSYVRIGGYVLYQECASPQKRDTDCNLVLGTVSAGGVRDDGNQGAVYVAVANADHEGGANLPLHAKIEKPYLTAARRNSPRC